MKQEWLSTSTNNLLSTHPTATGPGNCNTFKTRVWNREKVKRNFCEWGSELLWISSVWETTCVLQAEPQPARRGDYLVMKSEVGAWTKNSPGRPSEAWRVGGWELSAPFLKTIHEEISDSSNKALHDTVTTSLSNLTRHSWFPKGTRQCQAFVRAQQLCLDSLLFLHSHLKNSDPCQFCQKPLLKISSDSDITPLGSLHLQWNLLISLSPSLETRPLLI